MKKKNTNLNIRLDSDLFNEFKRVAEENDSTASAEIRRLMKFYINMGGFDNNENSASR